MTTTPAEPVSRRARPAKSPLTREAIVHTGLRVLDRDGMDALTMRKVAQELDTGAASLYVYVKNREDLLKAMLDEALRDVPRPTSRRGTWQKRLTAVVEATVDAMSEHPGLAVVALGGIPTGLNALLILEHVITLLQEGGLDDLTTAWAVDLLFLHMTAAAAERSAYNVQTSAGQTEADHVRTAGALYASLPPQSYPMITGMREQLFTGDGEERGRWALKVLLNGILDTPAE